MGRRRLRLRFLDSNRSQPRGWTPCTATRIRRRAARRSTGGGGFIRRFDADRALIHERGTANGKRVQALGGAKNHAIVLPDANIDFASEHLSAAAFGAAGERCMAISVAVAVGWAADRVVDAVSQRAQGLTVGPGRDSGSDMGQVMSRAAKERIESIIGAGQGQGARVVLDGRGHTVSGHEEGFFVGPTVIDEVTPDMDVYTEEIFGPVLSVVRAAEVDEAIALINANPFGNGTAIFTNSGSPRGGSSAAST